LKDRFDYGQNSEKAEGGELISSYECDYMTTDAEFLLSKAKYTAIIIIRPRWTAPGNTETFGDWRGPCGGSPTGYVWKMTCP